MAEASNFNGPNALESLDNRSFTRHHVKAILVSGVGFLADQYDLQSINILTTIIGYVYFAGNNNTIPTTPSSLLSAAATVGAIAGQVIFGILADRYGRKRMYGIELMIIIIGTVGASLSANTAGGVSVVAVLCFWRLFQGVGIGADYPMSATIAAEFANKSRRGTMLAAVFSMQGFGTVGAYIVAIVFLYIFKDTIESDPAALDHVWRIVVVSTHTLVLYFFLFFFRTLSQKKKNPFPPNRMYTKLLTSRPSVLFPV